LVVIRPTLATLRSRKALVVVVVPWTSVATAARSNPEAASAAMTPAAWLLGVVGVLTTRMAPASSTAMRSVKVPPTSMPIRIIARRHRARKAVGDAPHVAISSWSRRQRP
jgi:hypothetical protein